MGFETGAAGRLALTKPQSQGGCPLKTILCSSKFGQYVVWSIRKLFYVNRIHWISIKKNPNLTQTSLRPTTLFEVTSSLTFIKVGRERLWRAINDREFMRSRVRIPALDHLYCGLKIGNNVGMDRKSTKEVVNDLLKHLNVYSFFKVHICDIYGNKFIIKCVVASSSTFYLEKAER